MTHLRQAIPIEHSLRRVPDEVVIQTPVLPGSRSVVRRWIDQGVKGHIVNITSGAALRARPGAAHYSTSKAALEMLTRAFALEMAPYHIHVNGVSPGFFDVSSGVNRISRDYVEALVRTIPWGEAGQPADIAEAVLFLCGRGASYITGEILRVDGGYSTGTNSLPLSRSTPAKGL